MREPLNVLSETVEEAKKRGKSYFGYKNHVEVDVKHKLIREYKVTDASVHDSRVFEDILDETNTSRDVYADSAYRSAEHEAELKAARKHYDFLSVFVRPMFCYGFLQIPPRDGHPCRSLWRSPCRAASGLPPVSRAPCRAHTRNTHPSFAWCAFTFQMSRKTFFGFFSVSSLIFRETMVY